MPDDKNKSSVGSIHAGTGQRDMTAVTLNDKSNFSTAFNYKSIKFSKPLAHISQDSLRGQLIEDHLHRVSELAEAFASKVGMPLAGRLVGLLHDLGKYSQAFQNYLFSSSGVIKQGEAGYTDPVCSKGKIVHSFAGGQAVWKRWGDGKAGIRAAAQMLALCIISHHSGLKDCVAPDGNINFMVAMASPEEKTHYAECLEKCGPDLAKEMESVLSGKTLKEICNVLSNLYKRMNDRLPQGASENEKRHNDNSLAFQEGLFARFLLSCLLDADRIDSADFEDESGYALRSGISVRPWDILVQRLERFLAGFSAVRPIDAIRREISDHSYHKAEEKPGFFTLTVPTGGGKTLASLRFALRHAQVHQLDRVIYVIPYTSIIDQNAEVARRILEEEEPEGSIVLEHHSNFLPERGGEDTEKRWEMLAENWDAPVIFTTMAQFLESLFGSGTRHARRMHNLAHSVIIFDEIQTLPLKCMHMFCNAADFLVCSSGASIVFCTATQPGFDNIPDPLLGSFKIDPNRELMPNVESLFARFKRTDFFLHCQRLMTSEDITKLAFKELSLHGSCLVVCNTKKMAENIYELAGECKDIHRYYLSTSLCPAHRMKKLDDLRKDLLNDGPVLCVSTQLIECGVDISFNSVIRLAAGLDSILQSAGRCNRHADGKNNGPVHVVLAEEKGLDRLQDIKEGQTIFLDMLSLHAQDLDASDNDLTDPQFIREYFTRYFFKRGNTLSYAVSKNDEGMSRSDTLLNMLGSNEYTGGRLSYPLLGQSFATAARLFAPIDSSATGVIVPYGREGRYLVSELCSSSFIHRKKELLRKAQRFSVNIFPYALEELKKAGALHEIQDSGILYLTEQFYSDSLGVMTQKKMQLMPLLDF